MRVNIVEISFRVIPDRYRKNDKEEQRLKSCINGPLKYLYSEYQSHFRRKKVGIAFPARSKILDSPIESSHPQQSAPNHRS